MIHIPEPIAFEWDAGNESKNAKKHNVSIKEAEEVFESRPVFFFSDAKHSSKEERYMVWGKTKKGRRLAIFFTIRRKKVRVVSARPMSKKERKNYEEKTKTNSRF